MSQFISFLNSRSLHQVNAAEYCLQTMLNALSGMNSKKGIKPNKQLMEGEFLILFFFLNF